MLDLRKAERFIERFHIRSRGQNRPIPFRLNPSQKKITELCQQHCDKGHRNYVIFLKARRLGVTTYLRALCQCHLLEKEYAEAIIMAQLKSVASSIYQDSVALARQLPLDASSIKTTQVVTDFTKVPSSLTWNTANSVKGTRGLAYTHLHATEAAFYDDSGVFDSVLSCLSDDPENMAFIETTPNGTEGPGAAYHELWQASVRGETEFLPIFLPWHDDPEYVKPAWMAKGAPKDDYEKYLMRDLKLGPERIAFYRYTLANKCSNRLDKWRREYPGTPEEAFEVTGVPVFDFEDTTAARTAAHKPVDQVEIKVSKGRNGLRSAPERSVNGRFAIFETPQPRAHYFMGVVVGSGGGDEEDSLAAVVWNGETGKLAARFQEVMHPATASELMCAMGVLYNKAMIAVDEGNGGFGAQIIQELRDRWRYPNPYRWKGRNDRVSAEAAAKSIGFSVNEYTRKMMLNGFIASLKRSELMPSDAVFAEQMAVAQWEASYPYEAYAGEDDVFWAGMLGWIARAQHHPRKCEEFGPQQNNDLYDDAVQAIPHKKSPFNSPLMRGGQLDDELSGGFTLQSHLDSRDRREKELRQG
jgi:hypothetical protein